MTAATVCVSWDSMASPAALCCRAPLYSEYNGDLHASGDACCSATPDLPGPISSATPPAAPEARHSAVARWRAPPDASTGVGAAVWVLLALLCLEPRLGRQAGIGAPSRTALGLSVVLTSAVGAAAMAPTDAQQASRRIHRAPALSAAGMQRASLPEVPSALPHGLRVPGRLVEKQRRSLLASVQPPPRLGATEGAGAGNAVTGLWQRLLSGGGAATAGATGAGTGSTQETRNASTAEGKEGQTPQEGKSEGQSVAQGEKGVKGTGQAEEVAESEEQVLVSDGDVDGIAMLITTKSHHSGNGTDGGFSKRPRGRPGPLDPEDKRKLLHEGTKDAGGEAGGDENSEHYEDGQGEGAEKGEDKGEKKGEVEELVEKILERLDDMEDKGGKFNETVEKQGAVLETVARVGKHHKERARDDVEDEERKGHEAESESNGDLAAGATAGDNAEGERGKNQFDGMKAWGGAQGGGDMSLMTMLFGKSEQQQGQGAEGAEVTSPGKGADAGSEPGKSGASTGGFGVGLLRGGGVGGKSPKPQNGTGKGAKEKGGKEGGRDGASKEKGQKEAKEQEEADEEKDVARLIDSQDNEYVISNPGKGSKMQLQEDFTLISDIVKVIVAAALGGLCCGLLGQPIILGYIVAGMIIGPGGLGLIHELVQVETLAQFGVVFLLFALGVEFNLSKMQGVHGVALGGGMLQILVAMALGGVFFSNTPQGLFIGGFLSMSSTAVVLKCLMDINSQNTEHGQIMLGTLISQDCALGLLLAIMPALAAKSSSPLSVASALLKELLILLLFCVLAWVMARVLIPRFLRMLVRLSRWNTELYQLGIVGNCLCVALLSEYLGLSLEVGAFVAGLMLSGGTYSERTLHQVEAIRNLFAALFLASIGMVMHPMFLWQHKDILLTALAVVFFGKALLTACVVRLFGYSAATATAVGVALAQIGEFSFVLLSRAQTLHLVSHKVYLLLMGTTALSLVLTPFAFKLVPRIVANQDRVKLKASGKKGGNSPSAPHHDIDGGQIGVGGAFGHGSLLGEGSANPNDHHLGATSVLLGVPSHGWNWGAGDAAEPAHPSSLRVRGPLKGAAAAAAAGMLGSTSGSSNAGVSGVSMLLMGDAALGGSGPGPGPGLGPGGGGAGSGGAQGGGGGGAGGGPAGGVSAPGGPAGVALVHPSVYEHGGNEEYYHRRGELSHHALQSHHPQTPSVLAISNATANLGSSSPSSPPRGMFPSFLATFLSPRRRVGLLSAFASAHGNTPKQGHKMVAED